MFVKKRGSKKNPKTRQGIILKITNSRKTYIPLYLMIIILIAVLIYVKTKGNPINDLALKLVILFSAISLIYTEIHRLYNVYEINNNSLVHTMGIITKRARKMDLSAISDLYVVQTIWQRMLLYGNVEVRMFSGENPTYIRNINNPSKFVDIVLKKISEEVGEE